MARDPRAHLWDVLQAATAILRYTRGMDAIEYARNDLVQAACERRFEIIGESLNQLARLDASYSLRIPDLAKIVAFRNQLIHGYATVNATTVWNILNQALPELITVIEQLLDELN